MTLWDAILMVSLWALIAGVVIIPLFLLLAGLTHGRGPLYKSMQDYGPDSPITLDFLNNIARNIAQSEYYMCGEVFMSHEYGNRYSGYFYDGYGHEHQLDITTDGWNVSYSIDGGLRRRYK